MAMLNNQMVMKLYGDSKGTNGICHGIVWWLIGI